jgi:hypothetical protein
MQRTSAADAECNGLCKPIGEGGALRIKAIANGRHSMAESTKARSIAAAYLVNSIALSKHRETERRDID